MLSFLVTYVKQFVGNVNQFMKPNKVRPLALGIFRRDDAILVARGHDSVKHQTYYRPLGGKIEFGELGAETVVRELREEINAEVVNVRYLGTLENIFTYEGQAGHEIVLVYEAEFADAALYRRDTLEGNDDHELLFTALWLPLSAFTGPDAPPLYPDGLLELLQRS